MNKCSKYQYIMAVLAKGALALVLLLLLNANFAMAADPGDDLATCDITVTVNTIMEWVGNFANINLTAISSAADTPSASQTQTLYTNCNLDISADNTTTAQLTAGSSTLTTEYQLAYDGDGSSTTGGTDVGWTDYSTFLSTPSTMTHIDGDGTVDITLSARASITGSGAGDAGVHTATQTLTAAWTSD